MIWAQNIDAMSEWLERLNRLSPELRGLVERGLALDESLSDEMTVIANFLKKRSREVTTTWATSAHGAERRPCSAGKAGPRERGSCRLSSGARARSERHPRDGRGR